MAHIREYVCEGLTLGLGCAYVVFEFLSPKEHELNQICFVSIRNEDNFAANEMNFVCINSFNWVKHK